MKTPQYILSTGLFCLAASMANAQDGTPVEFNFTDDDAEGWTVVAPDVFAPVLTAVDGDNLLIQSTSNTNSFAFWNSPVVTAGVIDDKVVKATFRVFSNRSNPVDSPTLRVRANSEELDQAFLTVATSSGDGAFSPFATTKEYILFYKPRFVRDDFSLAFDMLNFMSDNDADGLLGLESVSAELFQLSGTPRNETDGVIVFAGGNTNGWTFKTAEPAFEAPPFRADAQGLAIGGNPDAVNHQFGLWESPAGTEDAIIAEAGRFYFASFVVKSSTNNRETVPTLRLRINTENLQGSSVTVAESVGPLAGVPTLADAEGFAVYFAVPDELDGQELTFAFDYIYSVGGPDDNPGVELYLQAMTVVSLPLD